MTNFRIAHFVNLALLAPLLLPALASAQVPPPSEPALKCGAWAGTLALVEHDGDKREVLFGRLGANLRLSDSVHVGARLDMSRAQDGGAISPFDVRSFRDLEPSISAYWQPSRSFPCGPAAAGAVTLSIEGADGPSDPRLWTGAAGIRCGDSSGGLYAYALAGHRGEAGSGLTVMGAAQVPAEALGIAALHGASILVDGVPWGDGRFLRAGVVVRVPSPW